MLDNLRELPSDKLELDESIMLLKEIANDVSLTDMLTQPNINAIANILEIIKHMDIPVRMSEEKN